jgi:hypothetical protein
MIFFYFRKGASDMNNVKLIGFFLAMGVVSANSMADYTPSTDKNTSSFQCTTSVLPTFGIETQAPTAYITTTHRLVKGLCLDGGNVANGVTLGKVIQKGHLVNLPMWWRNLDGTIVTLNDICFNTKADRNKGNIVGKALDKNQNGYVGIFPETGSTSIICREGCVNTKYDFGTGDFC